MTKTLIQVVAVLSILNLALIAYIHPPLNTGPTPAQLKVQAAELTEEYSVAFGDSKQFTLTVVHDEVLGLTHTVLLDRQARPVSLTTIPDGLTALEMAILIQPSLEEGVMPTEAELDAAIEVYRDQQEKN